MNKTPVLLARFCQLVLLAAGAFAIMSSAGADAAVALARVTAIASPTTVARGAHGTLTLTVAIKPGFHINAADPGTRDLIPTTLALKGPAGITFGKPQMPAAQTRTLPGIAKPIRVYSGKSIIHVPFTVAPGAHPGRAILGGALKYQGCSDSLCYPPTSAPISAAVTVR